MEAVVKQSGALAAAGEQSVDAAVIPEWELVYSVIVARSET